MTAGPRPGTTGGIVAEHLGELQLLLREARLEGWLLHDHRGANGLAARALGLEELAPLRRWFYWVPADGMPALIAHAIEIESFGELPGDALRYDGWSSLRRQLERILPRRGAVAMEHQEIGGNPELSRVDCGTVALVRSYGPRVVCSAEIVNVFLGPWRPPDEAAHARALALVLEAEDELARWTQQRRGPLESELREAAAAALGARGLVLGRPPMVASGPNSRAPHHRSRGERDRRLMPRDLVVLDFCVRAAERGAPFVHRSPIWSIDEVAPDHARAFAVVRTARQAAIELVDERARSGARLLGFEVDELARTVLARGGLEGEVLHRTGHHLGRVPFSGEACTFDSLEYHDTREVVPGLAWSVHTGLYLEEFGIRACAQIQRTADGVRVLDPGQDEIRVVASR